MGGEVHILESGVGSVIHTCTFPKTVASQTVWTSLLFSAVSLQQWHDL